MLKMMRCNHCGNMVVSIKDAGVPIVCCGENMEVLEPNTVDAAQEKHVPEVGVAGDYVTVKVGSVEHPMTEEHYITHIILETDKGYQIARLTPQDKPEATFALAGGAKAVAVYEYCNLHGLWKKEL